MVGGNPGTQTDTQSQAAPGAMSKLQNSFSLAYAKCHTALSGAYTAAAQYEYKQQFLKKRKYLAYTLSALSLAVLMAQGQKVEYLNNKVLTDLCSLYLLGTGVNAVNGFFTKQTENIKDEYPKYVAAKTSDALSIFASSAQSFMISNKLITFGLDMTSQMFGSYGWYLRPLIISLGMGAGAELYKWSADSQGVKDVDDRKTYDIMTRYFISTMVNMAIISAVGNTELSSFLASIVGRYVAHSYVDSGRSIRNMPRQFVENLYKGVQFAVEGMSYQIVLEQTSSNKFLTSTLLGSTARFSGVLLIENWGISPTTTLAFEKPSKDLADKIFGKKPENPSSDKIVGK